MAKCQKCPKEAITHINYSGADLCEEHFIQFVEKRAQKEIKQQGRLSKGSTLAIAVSGGKDSMTTLSILSDIFRRNKDINLVALSVDEGIRGYRQNTIDKVTGFCEEQEIEFEILSFKGEFGIVMDQVAESGEEHRPCTYCGVLRRSLLNRRARKLGATKIALGHNLDDMSQTILMNVVNGDVQRLVRLGPHVKVQKGLVPRMLPLRTIPEDEIKLYAELKKIPFLDKHCPYRSKAHRLGFLKIINDLEKETPGTKHSIVSTYDQIIEPLRAHYPPAELKVCEKCGEPSMRDVCKACELLSKITQHK